jgi:hypothetical protein
VSFLEDTALVTESDLHACYPVIVEEGEGKGEGEGTKKRRKSGMDP